MVGPGILPQWYRCQNRVVPRSDAARLQGRCFAAVTFGLADVAGVNFILRRLRTGGTRVRIERAEQDVERARSCQVSVASHAPSLRSITGFVLKVPRRFFPTSVPMAPCRARKTVLAVRTRCVGHDDPWVRAGTGLSAEILLECTATATKRSTLRRSQLRVPNSLRAARHRQAHRRVRHESPRHTPFSGNSHEHAIKGVRSVPSVPPPSAKSRPPKAMASEPHAAATQPYGRGAAAGARERTVEPLDATLRGELRPR